MQASTLILVVLSCQGYWLGGRSGTVSVQVNPEALPRLEQATFEWKLLHADVLLAQGDLAVSAGQRPAALSVKLPEVRVRTAMQLTHRLLNRGGTAVIAEGRSDIHLFPDDLLKPTARLVARHNLLVIAPSDHPLVSLLSEKSIPHDRADSVSPLARSRVMLIPSRPKPLTGFEQTALLNAAAAGSNILLFQQDGPDRLFNYKSVRRKAEGISWLQGRPLWRGLEANDLARWFASDQMVTALRVPVHDSAEKLAYWPPAENKVEQTVDSAVLSKPVGSGRIVVCQLLKTTAWSDDPRLQVVLANAIQYLADGPDRVEKTRLIGGKP
jgi:hypothetical protein